MVVAVGLLTDSECWFLVQGGLGLLHYSEDYYVWGLGPEPAVVMATTL